MAANGYFITGTDTGCGKTEVSLALMQLLQQQGYRVLGMKPVASGGIRTPDGLRNDDAQRLLSQGSQPVPYQRINPYLFEPPVAPHIAAQRAGVSIELGRIEEAFDWLRQQADWVICEGVGGWAVPLGEGADMAQLAIRLNLPIILVVGLQLGCLNHALLTASCIRTAGAQFKGWVANRLDPEMLEQAANISALEQRLDCRCLGVLPNLEEPSAPILAKHLRLP